MLDVSSVLAEIQHRLSDNFFMKRSRFQILLVIGLLGLLGVLAALQYVWLGQISDAEKDRMTKRLQTDTARFAEDFNRERCIN